MAIPQWKFSPVENPPTSRKNLPENSESAEVFHRILPPKHLHVQKGVTNGKLIQIKRISYMNSSKSPRVKFSPKSSPTITSISMENSPLRKSISWKWSPPWKCRVYFFMPITICKQWTSSITCPSSGGSGGSSYFLIQGYSTFQLYRTKWLSQLLSEDFW